MRAIVQYPQSHFLMIRVILFLSLLWFHSVLCVHPAPERKNIRTLDLLNTKNRPNRNKAVTAAEDEDAILRRLHESLESSNDFSEENLAALLGEDVSDSSSSSDSRLPEKGEQGEVDEQSRRRVVNMLNRTSSNVAELLPFLSNNGSMSDQSDSISLSADYGTNGTNSGLEGVTSESQVDSQMDNFERELAEMQEEFSRNDFPEGKNEEEDGIDMGTPSSHQSTSSPPVSTPPPMPTAVISNTSSIALATSNDRQPEPLHESQDALSLIRAAEIEAVRQLEKEHHRKIVSFDWSYDEGGSDWEGICRAGPHQSPVDIVTREAMERDEHMSSIALFFHYSPAKYVNVTFTGRYLKVEGDFGFVQSGGIKYWVSHMEVHAPSEHTINEKSYAMELQIYHNSRGEPEPSVPRTILAISIMFKMDGHASQLLESLDLSHVSDFPGYSKAIRESVDLYTLTKSLSGPFYAYEGSLTSPPCNETVTWRIMRHAESMDEGSHESIQRLFSKNLAFAGGLGNNRKVQPLNERIMFWARTTEKL